MTVFAEMDFWTWGMNQGVSLVMLLFAVYAVLRASSWLGPNFFIPLRDAGINHLSSVDRTLDSVDTSLRKMSDALDTDLKELSSVVRHMETMLSTHIQKQEVIKQILEQQSSGPKN